MPKPVKTHRGLTTDHVVDAALALADAGGIDAVSLRRLASVLDVTPMAIYRHVRDKADLLDLMADRLLRQLELPGPNDSPWQASLTQVGTGFMAVLRTHAAAPLLLARPFTSQAALHVSETMLGILDRAGFRPAEAVRLLQVLTGMLLGPAIHRAAYAAAWREAPMDAVPNAAALTLTPDQFPHLLRVAGELMDWPAGPEADRLLIDLWVAGVDRLAGRQGGTATRGP
jgi:AcrR family transcriptional regulator